MMYDFQRALLLLYTNEPFFARFKENSRDALTKLDLTDRERRALSSLSLEELSRFRHGLQTKRMSVSRKIIAQGNIISLISFWKESPAIMWGRPSAPRTELITDGIARLLREIFRAKDTLSLASIFRARTKVAEKVPLRDVVRLVRLALAHRLLGKDVFAG